MKKKYTKKKKILNGGARPRPPPPQPKKTWSEKNKKQRLGTVAKALVWNAPLGIIKSPFKFLAGSYEWQKKRRTKKLEEKYTKTTKKLENYSRRMQFLNSPKKRYELRQKMYNLSKNSSRAYEHLSKGKRLGYFQYGQNLSVVKKHALAGQEPQYSKELVASMESFHEKRALLEKKSGAYKQEGITNVNLPKEQMELKKQHLANIQEIIKTQAQAQSPNIPKHIHVDPFVQAKNRLEETQQQKTELDKFFTTDPAQSKNQSLDSNTIKNILTSAKINIPSGFDINKPLSQDELTKMLTPINIQKLQIYKATLPSTEKLHQTELSMITLKKDNLQVVKDGQTAIETQRGRIKSAEEQIENLKKNQEFNPNVDNQTQIAKLTLDITGYTQTINNLQVSIDKNMALIKKDPETVNINPEVYYAELIKAKQKIGETEKEVETRILSSTADPKDKKKFEELETQKRIILLAQSQKANQITPTVPLQPSSTTSSLPLSGQFSSTTSSGSGSIATPQIVKTEQELHQDKITSTQEKIRTTSNALEAQYALPFNKKTTATIQKLEQELREHKQEENKLKFELLNNSTLAQLSAQTQLRLTNTSQQKEQIVFTQKQKEAQEKPSLFQRVMPGTALKQERKGVQKQVALQEAEQGKLITDKWLINSIIQERKTKAEEETQKQTAEQQRLTEQKDKGYLRNASSYLSDFKQLTPRVEKFQQELSQLKINEQQLLLEKENHEKQVIALKSISTQLNQDIEQLEAKTKTEKEDINNKTINATLTATEIFTTTLNELEKKLKSPTTNNNNQSRINAQIHSLKKTHLEDLNGFAASKKTFEEQINTDFTTQNQKLMEGKKNLSTQFTILNQSKNKNFLELYTVQKTIEQGEFDTKLLGETTTALQRVIQIEAANPGDKWRIPDAIENLLSGQSTTQTPTQTTMPLQEESSSKPQKVISLSAFSGFSKDTPQKETPQQTSFSSSQPRAHSEPPTRVHLQEQELVSTVSSQPKELVSQTATTLIKPEESTVSSQQKTNVPQPVSSVSSVSIQVPSPNSRGPPPEPPPRFPLGVSEQPIKDPLISITTPKEAEPLSRAEQFLKRQEEEQAAQKKATEESNQVNVAKVQRIETIEQEKKKLIEETNLQYNRKIEILQNKLLNANEKEVTRLTNKINKLETEHKSELETINTAKTREIETVKQESIQKHASIETQKEDKLRQLEEAQKAEEQIKEAGYSPLLKNLLVEGAKGNQFSSATYNVTTKSATPFEFSKLSAEEQLEIAIEISQSALTPEAKAELRKKAAENPEIAFGLRQQGSKEYEAMAVKAQANREQAVGQAQFKSSTEAYNLQMAHEAKEKGAQIAAENEQRLLKEQKEKQLQEKVLIHNKSAEKQRLELLEESKTQTQTQTSKLSEEPVVVQQAPIAPPVVVPPPPIPPPVVVSQLQSVFTPEQLEQRKLTLKRASLKVTPSTLTRKTGSAKVASFEPPLQSGENLSVKKPKSSYIEVGTESQSASTLPSSGYLTVSPAAEPLGEQRTLSRPAPPTLSITPAQFQAVVAEEKKIGSGTILGGKTLLRQSKKFPVS